MTFTLLPAIDIRSGQVVRLSQGDYDRQTVYAESPIDTIKSYARDGASWLHLVDLDAARAGHYTLGPLVRQVRDQTSLRIQTGGGIRNADDVAFLLDAGVERVVVGTLAVREPDLVSSWLGSFGADRITVALDARQDDAGEWRLPVKGWTEVTTGTLEEFLDLYAGAGLRHVLVTDISRDGMLSGFATDLYSSLAKSFPAIELQASGGVRTLDDIRDAKAAGARAAILGRALLEKRFTLKEALTC